MKKYPDYKESLNDCDEECESANYHGLYGLATEIFDAMRPFIKEGDYNKVAYEIKERILRKI